MIYLLALLLLGVDDPPDIRVINQNGNPFVCFVPSDAQKLLELRLNFPLLQLKSEKLEQSNLIRDAEIQKLEGNLEDLSNQLLEQKKTTEQLEAEIAKPIPWYKHPAFWAFTGMVMGVTLYISLDKLLTHSTTNTLQQTF